MGNDCSRLLDCFTNLDNNSNVDLVHASDISKLNVQTNTAERGYIRVKAVYDYTARHEDDLSFKAGEMFLVSSAKQDSDWFQAKRATNNEIGYVPRNHVLIINDDIENHDGWQPFSRGDAVRQLLRVGLSDGTFILRPSKLDNVYAISVRYQEKNNSWKILHYKIIKTDDGKFYIGKSKVFSTIYDLVSYYQENDLATGNRLTKPYPKDYSPPVHFRDVEVNRSAFKLCEKIGEGKFGTVYHAKWCDTVDVAIKTHLKKTKMEAFINEAKIMHKLRHPKIVEFLGVCTKPEDENIFIITEFMINGSLLSYLRGSEARLRLSFNERIYFLAQIADGMLYLESMNVIHKDLRAANILVGENNIVKVSDFGLSFIADDYSDGTDSVFPYKWTAPEALKYTIFTTQSDIWSFGILMYEVSTFGQIPYPEMNNKETVDYVLAGNVMSKGDIDEKLYNIMLNCWKLAPEYRIKFIYLKELFEDWDALSEQYSNGVIT